MKTNSDVTEMKGLRIKNSAEQKSKRNRDTSLNKTTMKRESERIETNIE